MNESIDQPQKRDGEEEIRNFVEERLEARKRNEILPWNEDPLFKDFPLYEGPVPADLVERHDDYLSETDTMFAQASEFARQLLEEREKNALLPWSEDPFFKDHEVYDGPAPADLSERHDDYLYGEDEKS